MTVVLRLLAGTCLALSVAAPASAAICRWKDASGNTQYSDNPPPGVQCIGTVRPPRPGTAAPAPAAGAPGTPAPTAGKSAQEQEMEFRKRRTDKLEAEKKAAQEKEQAEMKRVACDNARTRLAGLQKGGRVAKYDASGQLVYLDEEQIARELADVKRAEAEACK
ncbi:MAG: DUF4124 domain-containing protein [Burkholderiales bacterium]